MLVAAGDKGEGSAAFVASLVTALSAASVRARAGNPGETTAAAAAQAAARASLEQAALVTAEVVPEGIVRGTGRVAVSCRANVRLVAVPAGGTVADRAATARVFVDADKAADGAGQCRAQLGADLAGRLAGAASSAAAGAASGRPPRRHRRRRRGRTGGDPGAGQEPARRGRRLRGRADARFGGAGRDPGAHAGRARRAGGRPLAFRRHHDHLERREISGDVIRAARAPARRGPAAPPGGSNP